MHQLSFHRPILASLTLVLATGGCEQILGLGDFKEGAGGSGTTTGSSTDTSSTATTTSTGPTTTGSGGDNQGGGGTGGGTSTSSSGGNGGSGGTACVPSGAEDCTKLGDEDCDGIACSDAVWSELVGSSDEQNSTSVAVDTQGNVILAGFFAGTMTFGNKTLISAGSKDFYLAKLDRNGAAIWAKQFGDASDNGKAISVAVASNGNISITGSFSGGLDFGTGPMTSAGSTDIFVAGFDANGAPIWSKKIGNPAEQRGSCIAIDSANNTIVGGAFIGSVDFGTGVLATPSNAFDGFIAKYSPTGTPINAKQLGDASGQNADYQVVLGITVDPANNILARGNFATSVTFGSGSLLSGSHYIAKLDSELNHSWSKKLSLGGLRPWIAASATGDMIIGGNFGGASDLDGHPIVGGANSIFLAKFDSTGFFKWAQVSNASDSIDLIDLATSADGSTVVAVRAFGDVNFGNGQLAHDGPSSNIALAKFGPDGGSALWSKMFGGLGQHDASAIATDPVTKEIVITGMITEAVDFGTGPLTSMGGYDVFLAKFQP